MIDLSYKGQVSGDRCRKWEAEEIVLAVITAALWILITIKIVEGL